MLEVHRVRQIEWAPSAVVALATSVNGTVVAAARENGAIELWKVAPGSVGWHCYLTIAGKEDAAISSLVWCKSAHKETSPNGRLFSAALDGFITEWDLLTLQPKEIVESHGGSVWQLAVEPVTGTERPAKTSNAKVHYRLQKEAGDFSGNSENSDASDSDSENEGDVWRDAAEQRVAVGCDDGCVRLFTVNDDWNGMVCRRAFPRLKGRILSVAWSVDGSKIYSGGSDGCVRCWDSSKALELFRITAGIGGLGGDFELCVWSILALRNGTIVSGDSTGRTQFWEGKHGTLLQAYAKHGADVLALAATPSHSGVFAAGADGQVVLFQHLHGTLRTSDSTAGAPAHVTMGALTDKWVFVGSKRTHTHDVRALAVAFPLEEGNTIETRLEMRVRKKNCQLVQKKWFQPGTAMLISGGSDSKLFTYPANAFLAFHPHVVCPAPQRPYVQLASEVGGSGMTIFIAQHLTWVDVWRMHSNHHSMLDMEDGLQLKDILGKRKIRDEGNHPPRKSLKSSGRYEHRESGLPASNGKKENFGTNPGSTDLVRSKGMAPGLLVRIKCKTADHISCSAISRNGQYVAFSDRLKPRLYQLDQQELGFPNLKTMKGIAKKKLPLGLPAAQSMQFTPDSTRLLLGCPSQIIVVDVEHAKIVHLFQVAAGIAGEMSCSISPMKFICTSADSQWLAATTSSGYVHVFNIETLRHHWSVPMLDGSVATSAIFRPSSSNLLIISTSTNQIHVLDVEAKELSQWSKVNGQQVSSHLLDLPGGIIGLSVPPTSTATSVIAYSSRAMCQIDFSKPLWKRPDEAHEFQEREENTLGMSTEVGCGTAEHSKVNTISNGVAHRSSGHSNLRENFVVVCFKDPVLFLGHTTQSSLLVVEKPWLEVLRQFPAPVFRHLYGT